MPGYEVRHLMRRRAHGKYRKKLSRGAVVEGAAGLFDLPSGGAQPLPCMADSEATTVAALREDYNRLLAALREAGLMAVPDSE